MRYLLYTIVLIVFSCSKSNLPDEISGNLLYLEDIDGKDSFYSWNFGDIVLFDLSNNGKNYITDDHYFNNSASYDKYNQQIIFESKRGLSRLKKYDLSYPSSLYTYSLKTKNIKKISSNLELGFKIFNQNFTLPFSSNASKNKFLFCVSDSINYNRKKIVLYDRKSNEYSIIKENIKNIYDLRLSDDSKYLTYEYEIKGNRGVAINIINLQTSEENILKRSNMSLSMGNIVNDTLYYGGKNNGIHNIGFLYKYSIKTGESVLIKKALDYLIYEPIKMNEKIYLFLLEYNEETSDSIVDLYYYKKNRFIQLTTDGHKKKQLRVLN